METIQPLFTCAFKFSFKFSLALSGLTNVSKKDFVENKSFHLQSVQDNRTYTIHVISIPGQGYLNPSKSISRMLAVFVAVPESLYLKHLFIFQATFLDLKILQNRGVVTVVEWAVDNVPNKKKKVHMMTLKYNP